MAAGSAPPKPLASHQSPSRRHCAFPVRPRRLPTPFPKPVPDPGTWSTGSFPTASRVVPRLTPMAFPAQYPPSGACVPHPFPAAPGRAHTPKGPQPMTTIHGYRHGDRVRDRRDGSTGTVRILDLTPAERSSGDYAEAEIRWDTLSHATELELVQPHLERI